MTSSIARVATAPKDSALEKLEHTFDCIQDVVISLFRTVCNVALTILFAIPAIVHPVPRDFFIRSGVSIAVDFTTALSCLIGIFSRSGQIDFTANVVFKTISWYPTPQSI